MMFSQKPPPEYYSLIKKADSLFKEKEYKSSGIAYSSAFKTFGNKGHQGARYNAARSWALANISDSAFDCLIRIAKVNYFPNADSLTDQADFNSLHQDERWQQLLLLAQKYSHYKPIDSWSMTIKMLADSLKVTAVPESFGFDDFYKKYIDANGIPIVSSHKVADIAILTARQIIIQMLEDIKVSGVVKYINKYKVRIAVMANNEKTTSIPEYGDLNKVFPETHWDTRGRGFGATIERPVTSCAEENLLCYPSDTYRGECILVHEFAHTIHEMALRFMESDFDKKLKSLYESARQKGLWKNTYAISNYLEYWAEGIQDFFNTNLQAIPCNGIHNEINTREELKNYDLDLFNFISTYFIEDDRQIGCYTTN